MTLTSEIVNLMDSIIHTYESRLEWILPIAAEEEQSSLLATMAVGLCDEDGHSIESAASSNLSIEDVTSDVRSAVQQVEPLGVNGNDHSIESAASSNLSIEDVASDVRSVAQQLEDLDVDEENLLLPQAPVGEIFPQAPVEVIFPQVPMREIGASSESVCSGSDNSLVGNYMLGTSSYVPTNCYYDLGYYDLGYCFILPILLLRIYVAYKWFYGKG